MSSYGYVIDKDGDVAEVIQLIIPNCGGEHILSVRKVVPIEMPRGNRAIFATAGDAKASAS